MDSAADMILYRNMESGQILMDMAWIIIIRISVLCALRIFII